MGTALWELVTAAVVSVAAPAPQAATDADSRELASYRLSMAVVNQVAAATRAMVAELKRDPQFQEVAKVNGEIKALEAKPETTEAEMRGSRRCRPARRSCRTRSKGPSLGDVDSLSEMEAQIRKVPPLMAGLRSANMRPRDYAKFMLASLQARMVAGLKKQGMLKEIPKNVSVENVQFMEAHEAELQALQKELSALGEAP